MIYLGSQLKNHTLVKGKKKMKPQCSINPSQTTNQRALTAEQEKSSTNSDIYVKFPNVCLSQPYLQKLLGRKFIPYALSSSLTTDISVCVCVCVSLLPRSELKDVFKQSPPLSGLQGIKVYSADLSLIISFLFLCF